MLLEISALLHARPDVLLLDEPTNHLDLEAAAWAVLPYSFEALLESFCQLNVGPKELTEDGPAHEMTRKSSCWCFSVRIVVV